MFSPGFTGQRAQIISHDHAPHLDCSDCQVVQVAVKNMLVLRWSQRHIVSFMADPKGTLESPKGTVPFGKGLARTLVFSLESFPLYNTSEGEIFCECTSLILFSSLIPTML